MECRYCRASNAEDDHRCHRCGRRLRMSPVYAGSSAAAPELELHAEAEPQSPPPPEESAPRPRRAAVYQPSLFSGAGKVVAIESFAPLTVEPPAPKTSSPRPRARRSIPGQQSLDFVSTAASRAGAPDVEPVIYCDDPVAVPAHRLMAAALDVSVIVISLALFLGVFWLAGGSIVLNKLTLPVFGVAAALIALLYHGLWSLGNGDSAGMRMTHLRLVNFDGRPPSREQRFYRLFSGCVSLLAAGLGLIWALVDEESLTWHDHISKTFPTTY
jgi:uncharacterized RDD family membrane protein YckC